MCEESSLETSWETEGRGVSNMASLARIHKGLEKTSGCSHVGRVHLFFSKVLQCLYRRMDSSWIQEYDAKITTL